MPELPEVEIISRQLASKAVGQKVASCKIFDDKLKNKNIVKLKNSIIASSSRLGKQIVLEFNGNKKSFVAFHLRMTGNLIWNDNKLKQIEKKHLRLAINCQTGTICFYDVRRFGTIKFSNQKKDFITAALDPLDKNFTPEALSKLLKSCKQPLKPWLLRQDKLVGLGNYLASEILFRAKIRPTRQTNYLKKKEIAALQKMTVKIIQLAIKNCGTTLSDYLDAEGNSGSFQNFLYVYGRADKPCKVCRTKIKRIVQAGRSTFYCPKCQ